MVLRVTLDLPRKIRVRNWRPTPALRASWAWFKSLAAMASHNSSEKVWVRVSSRYSKLLRSSCSRSERSFLFLILLGKQGVAMLVVKFHSRKSLVDNPLRGVVRLLFEGVSAD